MYVGLSILIFEIKILIPLISNIHIWKVIFIFGKILSMTDMKITSHRMY